MASCVSAQAHEQAYTRAQFAGAARGTSVAVLSGRLLGKERARRGINFPSGETEPILLHQAGPLAPHEDDAS